MLAGMQHVRFCEGLRCGFPMRTRRDCERRLWRVESQRAAPDRVWQVATQTGHTFAGGCEGRRSPENERYGPQRTVRCVGNFYTRKC